VTFFCDIQHKLSPITIKSPTQTDHSLALHQNYENLTTQLPSQQ
jgi:hypothetical protein